jgi:hypothetical protein
MTVREIIEELAQCPDDSEVWDAVRYDKVGASKPAYKVWPVAGSVLSEEDNRVHVVGKVIRPSDDPNPITVQELVDELSGLPEQCEVMLGYSDVHSHKASRAGFPEYIGYSENRVYLISYIEGQQHVGHGFSVN